MSEKGVVAEKAHLPEHRDEAEASGVRREENSGIVELEALLERNVGSSGSLQNSRLGAISKCGQKKNVVNYVLAKN